MQPDPAIQRRVTRYAIAAWCVLGAGIVCFVVGGAFHIAWLLPFPLLGFVGGAWILAALFLGRSERDGQPQPRHAADIMGAVGLVLSSVFFIGAAVLWWLYPEPAAPMPSPLRTAIIVLVVPGGIGFALLVAALVWAMVIMSRKPQPPSAG